MQFPLLCLVGLVALSSANPLQDFNSLESRDEPRNQFHGGIDRSGFRKRQEANPPASDPAKAPDGATDAGESASDGGPEEPVKTRKYTISELNIKLGAKESDDYETSVKITVDGATKSGISNQKNTPELFKKGFTITSDDDNGLLLIYWPNQPGAMAQFIINHMDEKANESFYGGTFYDLNWEPMKPIHITPNIDIEAKSKGLIIPPDPANPPKFSVYAPKSPPKLDENGEPIVRVGGPDNDLQPLDVELKDGYWVPKNSSTQATNGSTVAPRGQR
ncbi:hypothetical protein C1H76_6647 [Elsinoe australis]|uniref:Uncharacterized protein n=1 Tax=Elsinoe australis TaxID=40998 RepID=A0A4U7AX91_9PEZI|nr:hypothetical protein C1H76_6647 [Elsinoe australis]